VTIFVSTAYLDEAERCHRVGLIHQGKLLAVDTPDGLKRLMPGAILELRCAEPRRAAQLLCRELPADSVGLFGDRVHVVTPNPEAGAETVAAKLAREAIRMEDLRVIEPTLEDVFVSVLSEKR
jgi:ABC-2 type transport system ATP-binding protein